MMIAWVTALEANYCHCLHTPIHTHAHMHAHTDKQKEREGCRQCRLGTGDLGAF